MYIGFILYCAPISIYQIFPKFFNSVIYEDKFFIYNFSVNIKVYIRRN